MTNAAFDHKKASLDMSRYVARTAIEVATRPEVIKVLAHAECPDGYGTTDEWFRKTLMMAMLEAYSEGLRVGQQFGQQVGQ